MAAEEAAQEAENLGGMSQEDVEDYMEALDASSASVEDDFLDLDDEEEIAFTKRDACEQMQALINMM